MIKNIILDLDETLIETKKSLNNFVRSIHNNFFNTIDFEIFNKVFYDEIKKEYKNLENKEFFNLGIGYLDIFFENGLDRFIGIREANIMREKIILSILSKLNVSYQDNLSTKILRFMMSKWQNYLEKIDGVDELLNKLQNYNLYLLTDGFTDTQLSRAYFLNLDKYFKRSYASEDLEKGKKFSIPFMLLMKENNLIPEETLMIGDNYQSDYLGSKNCGITPIYFDRYNRDDIALLKASNYDELLEIINSL
ncbi:MULTISPECIES: HAD family hydrolase [Helcococcus]|uniref:HAD family hydrolase n=1 Tax=Helcococcus bovis TaxID=3153252 RepID=A0ABW9F7J8_9FIRM